VPAGVKIAMQGGKIDVQGRKANFPSRFRTGSRLNRRTGILTAKRATEEHRALHGLARALVANAVHGVTSASERAGHRGRRGTPRELKGKVIYFPLSASSHPSSPDSGRHSGGRGKADALHRQRRGQRTGRPGCRGHAFAAPPDPYKQKGVRITGERLKKKAGKAGAKAGGAA